MFVYKYVHKFEVKKCQVVNLIQFYVLIVALVLKIPLYIWMLKCYTFAANANE